MVDRSNGCILEASRFFFFVGNLDAIQHDDVIFEPELLLSALQPKATTVAEAILWGMEWGWVWRTVPCVCREWSTGSTCEAI
jgi:hypothetical protein